MKGESFALTMHGLGAIEHAQHILILHLIWFLVSLIIWSYSTLYLFTFYIKLYNLHFTLNSIWRGSLHYGKSTSNHPSVKLRRLIINPICNQPKHHSSKSAWANCLFTDLHKTTVEIYPQETKNNGLVGLVLSLHHHSNYRLNCRAFVVTKKITRTRLNSIM